MRQKLKYTTLFLLIFILFNYLAFPVNAQESLLPGGLADMFRNLGEGGAGVASFVVSRISTGMFFVLGSLSGFGVYTAFTAAAKYIRSQGDAGQIEEAQKAIKAILYGLVMIFVGIVGIVLIFVFFVSNRPDPSLFQTCLSAPNSAGCNNCQEEGFDEADTGTALNLCALCEQWYDEVAKGDRTLAQLEGAAKACIDVIKGGENVNCWETFPFCSASPP